MISLCQFSHSNNSSDIFVYFFTQLRSSNDSSEIVIFLLWLMLVYTILSLNKYLSHDLISTPHYGRVFFEEGNYVLFQN